jgi:dTDP-4-dehydrorhamnose 3,5-epimerase
VSEASVPNRIDATARDSSRAIRLTETRLGGAFVVEPKRFDDERGFFARSWSQTEFAERGIDVRVSEHNISLSHRAGTVRGMHFQAAPFGQAKLVRCTAGAIFDCIIDLRPTSSTFRQWVAVELSAANHLALYIPVDFAHGFQTLEDECEVLYQMTTPYVAGSERGVRWDDPAFGITWPQPVTVISERDRTYPDFSG